MEIVINSRTLNTLGLIISVIGTILMVYGSLDNFIKLEEGDVKQEDVNGKIESVRYYKFDWNHIITYPDRRFFAAKFGPLVLLFGFIMQIAASLVDP